MGITTGLKKALELAHEYLKDSEGEYEERIEEYVCNLKGAIDDEEAAKESSCDKCKEYEFKIKTIQEAHDDIKVKMEVTGKDYDEHLFVLGTVLAVLKGENTEYWAKRTEFDVEEDGSLTEVEEDETPLCHLCTTNLVYEDKRLDKDGNNYCIYCYTTIPLEQKVESAT